MTIPKVLIVGAGPSGLMMALSLHRYKVPFKIIDKKKSITSFSKALGMQARTLEIFKEMGVVKKILENGKPMSALKFYKGTKLLALASFARLETEYPFILSIPQSCTEGVLQEVLNEQGIQIDWNTELSVMQSYEDHIDVTLKKGENVSKETYQWVIGCDGIHSIVRESNGIPFLGEREPELFTVADVKIEGGIDTTTATSVIAKNNQGLVIFFPMKEGRIRIILNNCELERHETPTLEYINKIVKERFREDLIIQDLKWSSLFSIQYRKATLFSKGRCFLVGDSAHVHSPIGGQGMNTGLQDAYNLAWKLSLVIQGRAKPSLLKTYHEERWENAKHLLSITHKMTKILNVKSTFIKWLRPHIISIIINTRWINDKLVFRVSQLAVNYKNMSLSKDYCGCFFSRFGKAFKKAPYPGERVVDKPIQVLNNLDKNTLYDYLKGEAFHLIIFLTEEFESYESQVKQLMEISYKIKIPEVKLAVVVYRENTFIKERWHADVLIDKKGDLHRRYGALKPCMYLIRPDQYIGMRSSKINYSRIKRYFDKIF